MMFRAILRNAGVEPRRVMSAIRGWPRYVRERTAFREMANSGEFKWGRELPILSEWDASSGSLGAYFYQDQLVARWIHEDSPMRHVDVGSRLDGFVGSLSVFREVEVLDIRPQLKEIPNVKFHQIDLMLPLPQKWIGCTPSLSCLHTIEHFGLGRYGDTIDPAGHMKGLGQLQQMVSSGGLMYLSTPIGDQRIEFNAHRIFSPGTVLSWFETGWDIERCAVLDQNNQMHENTGAEGMKNFRGDVGLGIICARRNTR